MLYKRHLRNLIQEFRTQHDTGTIAQIATSLGIEPSYLSRFLSKSSIHFSDDLLYRLARHISLDECSINHLFVLREFERTPHSGRKDFLRAELRMRKVIRWSNQLKKLEGELLEVLGVVREISASREKLVQKYGTLCTTTTSSMDLEESNVPEKEK